MRPPSPFPAGFSWGAATAAYQVEGSPLADGAGASIWHRFCHTPGLVAGGDTGDVACDHYHRFRADVALSDSGGSAQPRGDLPDEELQLAGRGKIARPAAGWRRRRSRAGPELGRQGRGSP